MTKPSERLHPEVIDYMAAVAKLDPPEVGVATPAELRAALAKRRLAIRVPIENVGKVYERAFERDGRQVPVRVYEPASSDAAESPAMLPLVMVYHGGGWVMGNPDSEDPLARGLCRRLNAVVVSVDYGMAPEHRYPTAAEDCYSALEWALGNADELGIDVARIAVAGTSAGGNLSAVVALMARDRGGPTIAHQVLYCPVTDYAGNTMASYAEFATDYGLTRVGMDWFWAQYLGDDSARGDESYASPLRAADLSGLPDATVIVAECDVLRDEGEAYARAMQSAGVDVRLTRYERMHHGFNLVVGLISAADDSIAEGAERIARSFAEVRVAAPVAA